MTSGRSRTPSKVTKKSKTKFPPFSKTPGYSDIEKAKKFEQDGKSNSAIKFYKSGIEKLKSSTISITNAVVKRDRMQKIESYRQALFKLEHKQQKVSNAKVRQKNAIVANERVTEITPIEQLPGYEHIRKAMKAEQNDNPQKAIELYAKGIGYLEPSLLSIDNKKKKEKRRAEIDDLRHRKQRCQMKYDQENRVKKTVEHTREKARPITEDPGYALCEKGVQMERVKKYDAAIRYYQKGIEQMEHSLINVDNSIEKRKRRNIIDKHRQSMQKLKNQKIRKNGSSNAVISGKAGSKQRARGSKSGIKVNVPSTYNETAAPGTLNSSRIRLMRIHAQSNSLLSATNLGIISAPSIITPRTHTTGGQLYQYIREGNLASDIIHDADRNDIYFMLPVIISSIVHIPLPFYACLRDPMTEMLNIKIEASPSLEQRFRFFLYSYHTNELIQGFYGDHPSMPTVVQDDDDDNNNNNNNNNRNRNNSHYDSKENESSNIFSSSSSDMKVFEDIYLERDAIWFFHTFADTNPESGTERVIDSDLKIYDLMGKEHRIHKIKVKKVFKSKAKPLLISAHQKIGDSKYRQISQFIIKGGDDLRKDAGTVQLFRFMNSVWQEENLYYDGYNVRCLIYTVIPMGTDFGCIEFVPNCLPLRDISQYKGKFRTPMLKNLVATAAASYIASFVLGVRDRHFDNVLIRSDGTLFHIDFGFVMGESLFLDTAKIAITTDLQDLMEDHWEQFIEIGTEAYMKLRVHFSEIVEYAKIVFDFVELEADYQEFLYKMLHMDDDNKTAREYMRGKLTNAPGAWNTKLKNVVHTVAQRTIG